MVQTGALGRVICIVGPTASGKTPLALRLARETGGEIIVADSRQIYRELDIAVAKPTADELAEIPHHLVDEANLGDPWDLARFVTAGRSALGDIAARGKTAIVVGGTGLYVDGLIRGVSAIPRIPAALREGLRAKLAREGLPALYANLRRLDAEGASRLKPGDAQRILRALEVVLYTGRALSSYWGGKGEEIAAEWIVLDPERRELHARIDARVEEMRRRGLRAEARRLIREHPGNAVLAKTIGYADWLRLGFDDEERVFEEIRRNTRRYAKRQATWWRSSRRLPPSA